MIYWSPTVGSSVGSLFESRQEGVLLSAIAWIEGTLLGPLATIIAIIAVAVIGFMLLSGRLFLRDGGRVLLGCFILFGAGSIAVGIRSLADDVAGQAEMPQTAASLPAEQSPLTIPEPTEEFDPYAGASVPRN